MNPRDATPSAYGQAGFVMIDPPARSQLDLELENAERYFHDFPGNEGLTCLKCGAAVSLGWQHIAWHERDA